MVRINSSHSGTFLAYSCTFLIYLGLLYVKLYGSLHMSALLFLLFNNLCCSLELYFYSNITLNFYCCQIYFISGHLTKCSSFFDFLPFHLI